MAEAPADIVKNTGALVAYTNMSKRWNWGFTVEQSPYIAGGYAMGQGIVNGEPVCWIRRSSSARSIAASAACSRIR